MEKIPKFVIVTVAIITILFVVLTLPPADVKKPITLVENQTECAKEGETVGAEGMPESCCSGLTPVGGWPGGYDGDCSLPAPPSGLQICSNCGDGTCNENTGENKCNCPEDCNKPSGILFNKSEWWGPCPSNEPGACQSKTTVYNEGKIVKDGKTYYLDDTDLVAIIESIQDSGVLDKECGDDFVLDYSATYTINLDGKTKSINFPNCKDELRAVDEIIEGIIENSKPSQYLELHEWGVLGGCVTNETFFVTSRPEQMMYADLPIVYVHSEGIDSFDAEFSFTDGEPTDSYPDVPIKKNMVAWYDVMLSKPQVDEAMNVAEMDFGTYRMPIEDLIPTLNDVDADTLYYGDEETKFLFYEGVATFENYVDVSFDTKARTATFTNKGDNTAYNVMLATMIGDFMNATTLIAAAGDLAAGEEKTVVLEEMEGSRIVGEDMLDMGFTKKETDAFLDIWGPAFFYPSNVGFNQLIYRLPQSEYDGMITANIDPEPDKMVRAMYVLVDVYK